MNSIPIPDEIITDIGDALANLNSPLQLGESKLLSFNIVIKYEQENPAALPYQALKAVLANILETLEKENPDYADILRGRFWEGLSPKDMIAKGRPKRWAERTFYNYLRKAKDEFFSLFWQREQSITQNIQSESSVSLDVKEMNSEENNNNGEPRVFSRLVLILLLVAFAVGALFFIISNSGKKLPVQTSTSTLTETSTPVTLSPTATDVIPAPTSQISVCGEASQTPVDLGLPRFIRSQGLSNFNTENTPGILNNTVRALAIDQTGLWIGYFASDNNSTTGVGHYDKKNLFNCDFSKIAGSQNINSIVVSQSGTLWIGTEKNGVLSFDGKEWHHYTTNDGLPSNEVFKLVFGDQGILWVGTWEGVAKFDGKYWSVPYQVQNDTIFNNHVSSIEFDSEQNIWVGHIRDGVSEYRQSDNKWIYYTVTTENGLAGDEIRSIVIRRENAENPESIWFATIDGGISRFEQGKWTVYRVKEGLPSNDVRALALDRYNRIWAATAKGVVYFDNKVWKVYNTLDTSVIAIGSSCPDAPCPFDDDHVWTGTQTMGLTHSRLPLPDSVLKVTSICFVTFERERTCPSLSFDTSSSTPIVTAVYPTSLKVGNTLRFEITVSPEGIYELREDRGDFMSNADDNDFNLFGAWPVIGVKGTIETGQPYTFTDYDNPLVAPNLPDGVQEKQFVSTWRMWMHTRYVGPVIQLIFTVKNN
ncbi:MAG: hypothetical protein IPP66_03120 [Anaerolineales bacterium]|nr:hypothetical protein [Anaerolineales bacterium]